MTTLNDLAANIHRNADEHGFWPPEGRNFGEMIALVHSELSEALEEHRKNKPVRYYSHQDGCPGLPRERSNSWCNVEQCIPKPEGVATELADAIIRILDTMHSLGVDIDDVVATKMIYNESRPHKHGKGY